MANFEPKTFNASDINGGQKFRNGDGITPEAINAPIESALLMQELATTQPQYIENGGSPSVTIENGQFVFANLKGKKGEQGENGEKGEQGVGMPSNMSQNANKTIIVDGSVVDGNWNATFIVQQGGKQRPICTQYVNHYGAKAEMVATANSAKFKFVNGSTDPQSYVEIFEDKINFSKPITVQGNPVGGGSSGSNIYYFAVPKNKGTVGYPIWVLPPLDGVKKIELVRYSWAGTPTSGFGGYPYYNKTDTNKILYEDGVWNLIQNQYVSGFYLDFSFENNSGSVSDSLFFITDSYGLIELYNYTSSSMGYGAIWERELISSDEFDYDSIELVFKITMN